jgi:endonuclease-3
MRSQNDVQKLLDLLDREYPDVDTSLRHDNPLQLLVATILSAQCTDERVNRVTETLFDRYRTARDFAEADLAELEEAVRPTGFFRNKAKSVKKLGQTLQERHRGRVPDNLDQLVKLPGVGRKTANVVLGAAFGVPGLVIDTHAGRISRRLGLTDKEDPVKVEYELMGQIPKKHWIRFGHQLIAHGRAICTARKPKCGACPLFDLCPTGPRMID